MQISNDDGSEAKRQLTYYWNRRKQLKQKFHTQSKPIQQAEQHGETNKTGQQQHIG